MKHKYQYFYCCTHCLVSTCSSQKDLAGQARAEPASRRAAGARCSTQPQRQRAPTSATTAGASPAHARPAHSHAASSTAGP